MSKIRNAIIGGIVTLVAVVSCSEGNKDTKSNAKTSPESAELKACMDKHRWDTTAVNTSRLAVAINFERMGKGELARHVSDYDAVKIVYCTPKK